MNDAEALTAIRAELDKWFRDGANEHTVLARIAQITGLNGGAKQ